MSEPQTNVVPKNRWMTKKNKIGETGVASSNDDVTFEVVPLGNDIVDSNLPTLGIFDAVRRELILPCLFPIFVVIVVVLRMDQDARVGVGEVRDDISPPLVVVHTQGDDEVLVGVWLEAKGARSATATHVEDAFIVHFGPAAPVGIVPAGLFDNSEEGIGVGLVDADGNLVTHSAKSTILGEPWFINNIGITDLVTKDEVLTVLFDCPSRQWRGREQWRYASHLDVEFRG